MGNISKEIQLKRKKTPKDIMHKINKLKVRMNTKK